tara:strand:+ start:122 stop:505 length:384 start_codon:yes stop_codon:yes gene_type:complete
MPLSNYENLELMLYHFVERFSENYTRTCYQEELERRADNNGCLKTIRIVEICTEVDTAIEPNYRPYLMSQYKEELFANMCIAIDYDEFELAQHYLHELQRRANQNHRKRTIKFAHIAQIIFDQVYDY